MRILYLHDYDEPLGGAEILMLRLREGMRRLGHDARLLSTSATHGSADYRCYGTTSRLRGLVQAANPFAVASLRRVLADFRPDVVHVGMFLTQLSPLILPLLREVPSVYMAMWYRAVCPLGTKLLPDGRQCTKPAGTACLRNGCVSTLDWLPLMAQLGMTRRWIDAFDAIVPISGAVKRELERAGIPCAEVFTLGVEALPRPDMPADPMLVGFAGRLVKEKGVDVLLQAFARAKVAIPAARLLVAGEGDERARLESLATELGIEGSVEFTGLLPRADVERRLAAAGVQAVCSRWAEPFGMVAPEAMLRGTAVIASDVGGLADIVRHDTTGLLVPPGDVDALAAALTRLLSNAGLARAMGAAGRAVANREYLESDMLLRLESLYASLIRDRRPARAPGPARAESSPRSLA